VDKLYTFLSANMGGGDILNLVKTTGKILHCIM